MTEPADPLVPAELFDARRHAASSRKLANRVLARQRLRRRVVPPLVVGSTVLFGGGISAAWVNGTLHGTASPKAPATGQSASWSAASSKAQTIEAKALDQVRRTLAADSQMLTSLSSAAHQALIANEKTKVINEVTSGGAGGSGSAGGSVAGGVPASGGGSVGSLGSLPALPPLPPMPSVNIPTTQGTTGATHVVP